MVCLEILYFQPVEYVFASRELTPCEFAPQMKCFSKPNLVKRVWKANF